MTPLTHIAHLVGLIVFLRRPRLIARLLVSGAV